MAQCYYAVLGVSAAVTTQEVRRAYRKSARLHHPDKGGDPHRFLLLQEAVEVLLDGELRAIYDHGGFAALQEHRDEKPKVDLEDSASADATLEKDYEWVELGEGEAVGRGEFVRLNMTTGQRMVARKARPRPSQAPPPGPSQAPPPRPSQAPPPRPSQAPPSRPSRALPPRPRGSVCEAMGKPKRAKRAWPHGSVGEEVRKRPRTRS